MSVSDRHPNFGSARVFWSALCVLTFASVATAQAPAPSTALAQPAPAASEAPQPAEPSEPAPVPAAGNDTRGEALRAYQAALSARKLAATVPLSTPRLK